MTAAVSQATRLPPRWVIRSIWTLHRAAYAVTGGRFGLRTPSATRWGMLRLGCIGRRTGRTRHAILGYLEDGPNLLTPAMNGWSDAEPAWWLNLQSHPDATVELPNGERRAVTARAATPEEQPRLWARFVQLGTSAYTDARAAARARTTAVVVLEPRRAP
jgi:deazaflavin-dependent oxidoreductase (nitroreductase family)